MFIKENGKHNFVSMNPVSDWVRNDNAIASDFSRFALQELDLNGLKWFPYNYVAFCIHNYCSRFEWRFIFHNFGRDILALYFLLNFHCFRFFFSKPSEKNLCGLHLFPDRRFVKQWFIVSTLSLKQFRFNVFVSLFNLEKKFAQKLAFSKPNLIKDYKNEPVIEDRIYYIPISLANCSYIVTSSHVNIYSA